MNQTDQIDDILAHLNQYDTGLTPEETIILFPELAEARQKLQEVVDGAILKTARKEVIEFRGALINGANWSEYSLKRLDELTDALTATGDAGGDQSDTDNNKETA